MKRQQHNSQIWTALLFAVLLATSVGCGSGFPAIDFAFSVPERPAEVNAPDRPQLGDATEGPSGRICVKSSDLGKLRNYAITLEGVLGKERARSAAHFSTLETTIREANKVIQGDTKADESDKDGAGGDQSMAQPKHDYLRRYAPAPVATHAGLSGGRYSATFGTFCRVTHSDVTAFRRIDPRNVQAGSRGKVEPKRTRYPGDSGDIAAQNAPKGEQNGVQGEHNADILLLHSRHDAQTQYTTTRDQAAESYQCPTDTACSDACGSPCPRSPSPSSWSSAAGLSADDARGTSAC
jgi:hypothetical protein